MRTYKRTLVAVIGSGLVAGVAIGSVAVAHAAGSSSPVSSSSSGPFSERPNGSVQYNIPGGPSGTVPALKSVTLNNPSLVQLNAVGQQLLATNPNAYGYIDAAAWMGVDPSASPSVDANGDSFLPIYESDGTTVIGTIEVGSTN